MKTRLLFRISTYALIFQMLFVFDVSAETIKVGTSDREMFTYIPSNLGAKRPLIISMHGMNQDANYQRNQAKFESIADTAKFAVVFPNGINKSWDISGSTDINFVLAIIDTMVNRYNIDRNRVYLSGFSMGGMFTYHAMTRIADKIAAFAPMSGYPMGGSSFQSSRPVPIIHFHGTTDGDSFKGVASLMAGWVARNGCPTTAVVTKPYPSNKSNSFATKHYWGKGLAGVEVVLMELAGKGHWISTDLANGIHTSEEIWKFCKNFALDLKVPTVQFTSPKNGISYTTFGGSAQVDQLFLQAFATDPDGTVASVEFFDGSVSLFKDEQTPYQFNWTQIPAGTHNIRAVVTDNEDRTAEATCTISINAPTGNFLISNLFNASGSIPAGWATFDGSTKRTGPMTGLGSGSRMMQFTNAVRDFDYGMYFRNTTGGIHEGALTFAESGSGAFLKLNPGIYELTFKNVNWNMPNNGEITCVVKKQKNDSIIGRRTVRPTTNIGNSPANSFSGTSLSSLWFEMNSVEDVVIAFYTEDVAWADAVITDVRMMQQASDSLSIYTVRLTQALARAKSILEASVDPIYACGDRTNLNTLFYQYNLFESANYGDYKPIISIMNDASNTAQLAIQQVKDSERQLAVYSENFANHIGGLPKGWRTFDNTVERKGLLTGLGSGCRVLQFTGATRDFNQGLYIRSINGTANMGFAKFAAVNTDSLLTLQPGKYTLKYRVCNWNRSSFSAITGKVVTRADSATVASIVTTPSCNIGNSPSNSFSGSSLVELKFSISTAGNYALEFYTDNAGWADAIITDINLTKSVYTDLNHIEVSNKVVKSIQYYDINGLELKNPNKGLMIKKTTYKDGSTKTEKYLIQ